jgi:hypothetical protein
MSHRGRLAEFIMRGLALALALLILVVLLVFSIVALAIAVVTGLLLFGSIWRKTRRVRAGGAGASRASSRPDLNAEKQVVEVEVLRVKELRQRKQDSAQDG